MNAAATNSSIPIGGLSRARSCARGVPATQPHLADAPGPQFRRLKPITTDGKLELRMCLGGRAAIRERLIHARHDSERTQLFNKRAQVLVAADVLRVGVGPQGTG